jgi:hypothetical protein
MKRAMSLTPSFRNKLCEFWDVVTEDKIFSSEGPARVADIETIFTENLLMIRDEASKVLEKPVDISSISAVNSFNDTVRQAIRHSAAENLEQELPFSRVGSPEYGAFYRYDFNICQGPGWTIQDDDVLIEARYAVSIDYNYEYLDVHLHVAFSVCLEEYNSQFVLGSFPGIRRPNLGTRRLEQAHTQEVRYIAILRLPLSYAPRINLKVGPGNQPL